MNKILLIITGLAVAMPALAVSSNEMADDKSPLSCSVALSDQERDEQRLWPATYYPVQTQPKRPAFVELAQPSGPTRYEYRLWSVVHYPPVQQTTRPKRLELAQMTGPARGEYRLWPLPARVGAGSLQKNEKDVEVAGTSRSDARHGACAADVEPVLLVKR